jgi:hypothetical protein
MTRRPEKTAAATRKARQGGGGFLGMEEMGMLVGKPEKCAKCDGSARAICTRGDCPQVPLAKRLIP